MYKILSGMIYKLIIGIYILCTVMWWRVEETAWAKIVDFRCVGIMGRSNSKRVRVGEWDSVWVKQENGRRKESEMFYIRGNRIRILYWWRWGCSSKVIRGLDNQGRAIVI